MNWSYIAGLLDGEGSIIRPNGVNGFRVCIHISNTNKEVLDEVTKFVGYGKVRTLDRRNPKWKIPYLYQITDTRKSIQFLKNIVDELIIKKEKCKEAIMATAEHLDYRRRHGLEQQKLDKAIRLYQSGMGYKMAAKLADMWRQRETFRYYLIVNKLMRHKRQCSIPLSRSNIIMLEN